MKIGFKIIMPIVGLVGVAVGVSFVIFYQVASTAIKNRTINELRGISELKRTELENYSLNSLNTVNEIVNDLTTYHQLAAYMSEPKDEHYRELRDQLKSLVGWNQNFFEYSLIDATGTVILSTNDMEEAKIKAKEGFFIKGEKSGYVESFFYDPSVLSTVSIVATPIIDPVAGTVGVFTAKLNLNTISTLMGARGGLGNTGETFLVNKYNTFITESRFEKNAALRKTVYTEGITKCLNGNTEGGTFLDYRNVPVIGYYSWLPDLQSCMMAKIDASEALAEMSQLRRLLLIGGAFLLIGTGALAAIMATTLTRRIQTLSDASQRVGRGDLTAIVPVSSHDEIGQLGTTLNKMTQQLKMAYQGLEERVTERTKALMIERNRSQKYLELAGAMIVIINNHGAISFLNKRGSDVLGYTQEEIIGKDWVTECIPEKGRDFLRERIRLVVHGQSEVREQYEDEILTKSGQIRLISWHNTTITDETGNISIICYGDDITVQHQLAAELENSKKFLDGIINAIPDPVFVKDKQHRFVLANNLLAGMTGKSREEMYGKDDYSFFPKQQSDVFWQKDQTVLDSGTENVNEEAITGADGLSKTIVTKKARFVSDKGEPYIVGVIRDVTELKRAAAALVHEKAMVERRIYERTHELVTARDELRKTLDSSKHEASKTLAIINSIGDGVFVLDDQKKIILVNPITEQMSGYSSQDLIGTVYSDNLKFVQESNRSENYDFIDQVFKDGVMSSMSSHTLLICKDGKELQVADSAAPLKDMDGKVTGCVVVFRDVSRAREIERMKDEFISIASHQLRTPLTALRWLTERMQKDPAKTLSDSQRELVEDMRSSTKRLISLVNDLLNISRIESGRIMVEPQPTQLRELVESVIDDVRVKSEERKQQIMMEIPNDLPVISIDPKLIRQTYLNLLTNAIKYSPEGTNVVVRIIQTDSDIRSEIQDSGYGIPINQQNRLFEKFFRADNVTGKDSDGSGLGLYLVKKVIDVSGGTLGFKSPLTTITTEDGKLEPQGTLFWFTLPLAGSEAREGEVTLTQ